MFEPAAQVADIAATNAHFGMIAFALIAAQVAAKQTQHFVASPAAVANAMAEKIIRAINVIAVAGAGAYAAEH